MNEKGIKMNLVRSKNKYNYKSDKDDIEEMSLLLDKAFAPDSYHMPSKSECERIESQNRQESYARLLHVLAKKNILSIEEINKIIDSSRFTVIEMLDNYPGEKRNEFN
jgi:hypothetical protein